MSVERRRQMVEPGHPRLSIVRQCELVSISRSGFYHRPAEEMPLNMELMRLVEPCTCYPVSQPFCDDVPNGLGSVVTLTFMVKRKDGIARLPSHWLGLAGAVSGQNVDG